MESSERGVSAGELARLRFLCRRGMKELDVLLQGFLSRHFESASGDQRRMFLRLLDREDPEIWSWIVGDEDAPSEFEPLLAEVRANR